MPLIDNKNKTRDGYLGILSEMEGAAATLASQKRALDNGLSTSQDIEYKSYQNLSRSLGEAIDNLKLSISRAKSKIKS